MSGDAPTTVQQDRPREVTPPPRVRRLSLLYGPGLRQPTFRRLDHRPLVLGREPERSDLLLPGTQSSRRHAQVAWSERLDAYELEDLGSTNGSFVDGRPVAPGERTVLVDGAVLRIGDCLLAYSEVPASVPSLREVETDHGPVDKSLRLALAEAIADRAAPSGLSILIEGPTGVGKERLAARVHAHSRRAGPQVAVNCAAFPAAMLASELFGHQKGAFTGATADRQGLITSSSGGTLFLDEIADLPVDQQPALLRVLQEHKLRPVGSDRDVSVDLRVVSATCQPLDRLERSGAFRGDLLARLSSVRIELPGLTHRKEDILPLFAEFLSDRDRREGDSLDSHLTLDAAEALLLYQWPKNIRELQQVASHVALYWDRPGKVPTEALPASMRRPGMSQPASSATDRPTREELVHLLSQHDWNLSQVARALGKHRTQVRRWVDRYRIDIEGLARNP